MPTPSPIRDVLLAIGEAIRREMLRLANERGRYPLRTNSKLAKSLRVEVSQARAGSGRFAGYTASSALTLYAEEYAQYLDRGRAPFTKKVPISALLLFIKQRGLGQGRGARGRFAPRTISPTALAFAIQNAIYKNGLKGRHFIAPAFALGNELVEQHLDTRLLDSMTLEIDKVLRLAK